MARPMKRVRVIDFSASGWRASESSACTMARPMARAGTIAPMAIASAPTAVETTTNQVVSRIVRLLLARLHIECFYTARDVDKRQHAEDVGLHQRFHDVEHQHRHRYQKAGDQQHQHRRHFQTEDISEQTY